MKKRPSQQEIRISLGKRVRSLRMEKGWSQEALAEASDLHRTYVGGIERGERNISLRNIEKLAASLDVSILNLFEEEKDAEGE